MNWWFLLGVAVFVLLGYVANRLGWIDLSNKNRRPGGGSGILSIGDEVFAPSRHEAAVELDRQAVLPAPAPVAGDPGDKVYDGRITIELGRPAGQRSNP
jgi:hypothetical protein